MVKITLQSTENPIPFITVPILREDLKLHQTLEHLGCELSSIHQTGLRD